MKVKAQDGLVVNTKEVEMKGKLIKCTPTFNIKGTLELGRYKTFERALEVFSELSCFLWNGASEYIMPKE